MIAPASDIALIIGTGRDSVCTASLQGFGSQVAGAEVCPKPANLMLAPTANGRTAFKQALMNKASASIARSATGRQQSYLPLNIPF